MCKTKSSSPWSAKLPGLTSVHLQPHLLPVSPALSSSHAGLRAGLLAPALAMQVFFKHMMHPSDLKILPLAGTSTCSKHFLDICRVGLSLHSEFCSTITASRYLPHHHPIENRPPHSFPFSFITSSHNLYHDVTSYHTFFYGLLLFLNRIKWKLHERRDSLTLCVPSS